jgi:tyrosyl-tRNA synthetase
LFAATSPLITRADGKKLGKTEEGTVWLDAMMTSPYKFYQFWLNVADEDASKYLRYFSLLSKEEIEAIEQQHQQAPHTRALQQALAKDITVRVHSLEDYNAAIRASKILFGHTTQDELRSLTDRDFEEIFEGVPTKTLSKSVFENGVDVMKLLVDETQFFPSKGEARRTIESNGAAVNKQTVSLDHIVRSDQLINNRYLLLQKGKKNYFLVIAE